ncbi:Aryl-phospho-beta-D-glucosidase BglC, GH1 family [Chryseolinea serpens]|uniref:Aryl-phospho-beta-D-glucosidase BglC, GH1 family n=1 Tax=Chryseolinea serpens TaxID=947013 RepID=A0A1M5TVR1_9BACT|nr:cellulase family glycosylhydrolase [Chryseolinea serpens]SHH54686.1 Aryl-phospho-beta-D-glucosidase BglC, GH1 family [Chryseolinea serpens]
MKIKCPFKISLFFIVVISFSSCGKEGVEPQLSVSETELTFPVAGGTSEITVTSSDSWRINNAASAWLQLTQTGGNSGSVTIQIIAGSNATGSTRSAVLVVSSDSGQSRRVTVSQPSQIFLPQIYPSYNTSPQPSDATGMSSTALQLADKIKLGWNLGNTMEAPGGETGWGSPVITEDYIKFVKQTGFNAIRIPSAWNWYHVDNKATAHIDQNWLNRVKEVVGYCVKNDMYVLLNIHWDGGWLENNCTPVKKDSVNAKQKALWEQIATTMRDFDEHLMFASANEPNADDATKMGVLRSYHQTFVDAVRSTGGRNTYRVLVLQGTPEWFDVSSFPTDPSPNRLMFEPHNYTPFQFTALDGDASWGKMFYYWGAGHHSTIEPDRNPNWGEEDEQLKAFKLWKENYVDKGIPVLMGEYGAYRRGGTKNIPLDLATHNDAVDYWLTYVTKQAIANGIKPFYWDTGGALDRANYTVKDQRTIDAILEGAK